MSQVSWLPGYQSGDEHVHVSYCFLEFWSFNNQCQQRIIDSSVPIRPRQVSQSTFRGLCADMACSTAPVLLIRLLCLFDLGQLVFRRCVSRIRGPFYNIKSLFDGVLRNTETRHFNTLLRQW